MRAETLRSKTTTIVLAGLVALAAVVWTAARSADAAAPGEQVVYVATGENFPDALGAAPAAALGRAPILLVAKDSIPTATADELMRLDPDRIVIVGGTGVISAAVEAALGAYAPTVDRIAGADRYQTAAEISKATFPQGHPMAEVAIIKKTSLDFNTQKILGAVTLDIPKPGRVVVRFDGQAIPDDGDRLILTTSLTGSWTPNTGEVWVYGDNGGRGYPFSNTRFFYVSGGMYTFEAIGQVYADTAGSGIASVYGTLTAQYYPDIP